MREETGFFVMEDMENCFPQIVIQNYIIQFRRNKMAEEVWMLQTKKADFKQIGARFRIDPVTARIIRNRGIEGEAAIDRY